MDSAPGFGTVTAPGTAPARLPAFAALAVLSAWLLAGCAAARTRPPPAEPQVAAAIVRVAIALVGTPYHFGGADEAGFDCSGLTVYVYERVGLTIPRTAAEQQRAAYPVPRAQLAPGDLVFFRIRSRSVDHVGVYSGDGRFVHAPRAGQAVSFADLDSGFYAQHLAGGGRFRESQTR
ncbi:MAG TPA: C40 family peptidase [Steroidobacteraceae bacterium]|nr:C40 family peptidase [Steroidobacteraceae bacterium]